ncbi:MAG: diguanylate cyclase domain-containing protein [Hylemonella sp.]
MSLPHPPTRTGHGAAESSPSAWRQVVAAARDDYTLAILLLSSAVAALWLLPFALYRAWEGNWVAVVNDLLLAVLFLWAGWRAWRTGDTRVPGWVVALGTVGGLWAIGWAARFAALFWVYPGVLMLFFLVPPRAAFLLAALAISGSAGLSLQELEHGEGLPFFVFTAALTAVLGYITSQQAHRRIARWQSLSLVDALTGVGNRRLMEIELDRADSGAESLGALVMMDLDHFKSINDRYGHEAGDQALRDFVAALQAQLRRGDRLYRLGGEEFVLWVPAGEPAQITALVERLRQSVRERVRVGAGEGVTVSAGICRHAVGQSWRSCLIRADQALYRAKQQGRDRVLWADDGHDGGRVAAPAAE